MSSIPASHTLRRKTALQGRLSEMVIFELHENGLQEYRAMTV
eukprot:CAMPEP_0116038674 /NCGR_PEP_ID=MMETSP0321-20121206/22986_1 /TAXON_ID=163516 /ORGANISM="Leptocylindrus danicus var. danicus, Strain B650" /LENGTH=41 /DNA_ID= /DNA_START= /DNA_END= /DNA_ORIENTATION=